MLNWVSEYMDFVCFIMTGLCVFQIHTIKEEKPLQHAKPVSKAASASLSMALAGALHAGWTRSHDEGWREVRDHSGL